MEIQNYGNGVYVRLRDEPVSITADEDAEVIVLADDKLCAIRIWLKAVLEAAPELKVRDVVADCLSSGWALFDPEEQMRQVYFDAPNRGVELAESFEHYVARRRGECDFRPWMFYQFSPAQGHLRLIDYPVQLDLSKDSRRIVGIDIDLSGQPRLHL